MPLVEWKDEYNTGIAEVDFEHRELIALINDSFEEAKKEGSSAALMDCLGDIFERISAHFALEEKVMKAERYDRFGPHKEDHERLLDSIRDIMDEVMAAERIDEDRFGQSLRDWFVTHFSTHDVRMHHALKQ